MTVAAPFVYLPELAGLFKDSRVKTAAEDVSRFDTGAYTAKSLRLWSLTSVRV